MKYYFLQPSSDLTEVGKFPQCETSVLPGNLHDIKTDGRIEDNVVLPKPILHKNAIATTFLGLSVVANSTIFLVADEAFVNLMSELQIKAIQKWNIEIIHNKKILKNYWIIYWCNSKEEEIVDYEFSYFYSGKQDDWRYRGKQIKIQDRNDFIQTNESLQSAGMKIKSDNLVFNFKNNSEPIVRIDNLPFGKGYYVTEDYKEQIQKRGFTGLEFVEMKDVFGGRINPIGNV